MSILPTLEVAQQTEVTAWGYNYLDKQIAQIQATETQYKPLTFGREAFTPPPTYRPIAQNLCISWQSIRLSYVGCRLAALKEYSESIELWSKKLAEADFTDYSEEKVKAYIDMAVTNYYAILQLPENLTD